MIARSGRTRPNQVHRSETATERSVRRSASPATRSVWLILIRRW